MTARVYLMADFGKGPIACMRGAQARWAVNYYGKDMPMTVNAPWWLVEAESADAARLTIKHAGHILGAIPICSCGAAIEPDVLGRILASGGAK